MTNVGGLPCPHCPAADFKLLLDKNYFFIFKKLIFVEKGMKVSVNETGGVVVIKLTGQLMGGTDALKINDELFDLLEKGKNKIIVDLEEVSWINSSGLGILIGMITRVRKEKGEMVLINIAEKIKEILRVTKLESIFKVYDSLEDAMETYK